MAITLRTVKGTALTFPEVDENFSSYYYSASFTGTTLRLFRTGSTTSGIPFTSSSITLPGGTQWTASIDNISRSGNVVITGSLRQGYAGLIASGLNSHAEGSATQATNQGAHAEGSSTIASGPFAHAEGSSNTAFGTGSHAEGNQTQAIGQGSHAEGSHTVASASYSHAEGFWTVASASYQHVQGQYNQTSSVQSAFIIGNGTSTTDRRNLVHAAGTTVQVTGSLNVTGSVGVAGSLTTTGNITGNSITATGFLYGTVIQPINSIMFDGGGNSGIRGSAPVGSAGGVQFFSNNNDRGFTFSSGSRLELGRELVRINLSGSVGIGTSTPQHTLDVSGSARVTNGLTVTGSVSISDILTLTRRTTTPTPVEGMIIASGSAGASILYYYNGTTWNALF